MTTHRIVWFIVLVTGMWLAVAPTVLAGGGPDKFALRLTLDKLFVRPGEAIQVTGTGAIVGVAANVLIVPFPASGANALTAVEVLPNAAGFFSATVTVPDTTATGRYAVRVEQPPGHGGLVTQYAWVGICVNACTGQTLGSLLPDTGGVLSKQVTLSGVLAGWLILMLGVNGIVWSRRRP